MTWLLTNDDGIDAPGIAALARALAQLDATQPRQIIAPRQEQSGCGHQVTTAQPIPVERRPSPQSAAANDSLPHYAVGGTPADCVRLGVSQLCPTATWVLSGINAGGNLGADVYISGTVAAVREAALQGLPGLAISHYRQGNRPIDWELASRWTVLVLAKLMPLPLEAGEFWNVNLPHLQPGLPDPALVFCQPCQQPLPTQYQYQPEQNQQDQGGCYLYAGRYGERPQLAGTDVSACFGGAIAVTKLSV
jgi:5'-nucleotidase